FTPETNCYEEHSSQDAASCYQDSPPLSDLHVPLTKGVEFDVERTIPRGKSGSNAWIVGPAKTRDKRAILANDVHLSLSVPNIWYRAQLRYGEAELTGLTLPGIPLVVVGSSGRVAWGFASIEGDFVDLVVIEKTGKDSSRYRTPAGMEPFRERVETINVRGKGDVSLRVQETIWGPVLREPLLGNPVALRWTALDPEATNLDLMSMDRVTGVEEALSLLNRAGGPAMSAVVADEHDNIGWTYMGRVPKRVGHSGLFSRSWKDGKYGWQRYVAPEALPRVVNPSRDVIISANQRMGPQSRFYRVGHDFSGGYRAHPDR
ncbi:MAG: penicillin acylase family protein, partial [Gammaproteobacteria bacterium]